MFTLYGMFAENEVKQRVERFTRKKRELMEAGMSISGKLLFGYKWVFVIIGFVCCNCCRDGYCI